MGVSLHRRPFGNLGILRDSWRDLEREHLSLWELCWGGLFLGIQKDMRRRAQGTDITLCWGPTGEFSRGLVYRGLAKALETGTFLCRGPVKYHGGSAHW